MYSSTLSLKEFLAHAVNYRLICINTVDMVCRQEEEGDVLPTWHHSYSSAAGSLREKSW